MKIVGVGGMKPAELVAAVEQGGKLVIYEYCISILVMTFKRGSDIHFVPAGKSRLGKGMGYTLLSLVAGWWGIPWGPIYTIGSVVTNLGGGRDVTKEVMLSFQ